MWSKPTTDGARPVPRASIRRQTVCAVVLSVVFAFHLHTQFEGVDFGSHWDEPLHFSAAQRMLASGTMLPGFYLYPSMIYDLFMVGTAPDLVSAYRAAEPRLKKCHDMSFAAGLELQRQNITEVLTGLRETFGRREHHLRVRTVFISISALAIIWVYLTVLFLGRTPEEALLAAAVQASSWEVAYHSRWIACDTVTMQFGILTTLLSVLAIKSVRSNWPLWLAAVAAGLACGTKYTAGLTLVTVLVAAWFPTALESRVRIRIMISVKIGLLFGLTYLISTPATLLEPMLFWTHFAYMPHAYKLGWFGHSVTAGLPHLLRNIQYLAVSSLSPFAGVSLLLFASSIWGLTRYAAASRRTGAILLVYPVSMLLVMSMQWAFIVRNLMPILPFLAIGAAHGIASLIEAVRNSKAKIILAGIAAMMMLANLGWLAFAASTIRERGQPEYLVKFERYVRYHSSYTYGTSPRVLGELSRLGLAVPENLTTNLARADYVCLYHREVLGDICWFPAQNPFMTRTWFGPREVNINYYPDWNGDDHLLVMHRTVFAQLPAEVATARNIMKTRRQQFGERVEGL